MKTKSLILLLTALFTLCFNASSQTERDIETARELRMNAAFLEMRGDFKQALQHYRESLQYVKDELTEKKIAELSGKIQVESTEADETQVTATPTATNRSATTLSKLDLDNYYLIYTDLQGIIPPLREELLSLAAKIDAVLEEDREEKAFLDTGTQKLDPLLEWLGVYSIQSYGASLASTGPKSTRMKAFVQFDENIESSALRQMIGSPSELNSRNYLPEDTALAIMSTFSIKGFWDMIKQGVERFGDEQVNQQMQASLMMTKEQMGIDIDTLVSTIADECFVAIRLNDEKTVSIPLLNAEPVEIEEPSMILGFKVADTSLYNTILSFITGSGMPINQLTIEGEQAVSIPLALPSPVQIEPTLMMHDGYLLITTTAELMESAVRSYINHSGISQSATFQNYFIRTPAKTSSLRYVSNRFYRTSIAFTKAMSMIQFKHNPDDALSNVLQEESIRLLENRSETELASYDLWNEEGFFFQANVKSATDNLIFEGIRQPILALIVFGIQSFQAEKQKKEKQAEEACLENLMMINHAKQLWGEDHGYPTDGPTQDDLEPYFEGPFPVCPMGGEYQINDIETPATCSIHTFE